jgi:hypothetical protein
MSLPLNIEKENSSPRPDSPPLYDVDRALIDPAEEIGIDRSEFLPVERIKAGIIEIALGSLLFAGLIAFCALR